MLTSTIRLHDCFHYKYSELNEQHYTKPAST